MCVRDYVVESALSLKLWGAAMSVDNEEVYTKVADR